MTIPNPWLAWHYTLQNGSLTLNCLQYDHPFTVLAEFTPENLDGRWPKYGGLCGTGSAHCLYTRHVKGIILQTMDFSTKAVEAWPGVVFVDTSDSNIAHAPDLDKR